VKPGFLVKSQILEVMENGVKVTFLGGIEGSIFSDHLPRALSKKELKIGTKITARVISVDFARKEICLSAKDHIVSLSAYTPTMNEGSVFTGGKVKKVLFGNSYYINVSKDKKDKLVFLHKTHAV
jgi:ribosomal protein S1